MRGRKWDLFRFKPTNKQKRIEFEKEKLFLFFYFSQNTLPLSLYHFYRNFQFASRIEADKTGVCSVESDR